MYTTNFLRNMMLLKIDITKRRNKEEGEAWLEVKDILVNSSNWSYKKGGELCSLTLEGYKSSYVARTLGISENTLRVQKKVISDEIYGVMGADFFELFDNFKANKKEIYDRIYIGRNLRSTSDNLLVDGVQRLIVNKINSSVDSNVYASSGEVDLSACNAEVSFLVRHSNARVKEELNSLDMVKLGYVMGILNSPSKGLPKERCEILKLMEGRKE